MTVLLWCNQRIGPEEAYQLANRYRRGNESVYVRTNVVFAEDGSVLHNGDFILSLHSYQNRSIHDSPNITTAQANTWM